MCDAIFIKCRDESSLVLKIRVYGVIISKDFMSVVANIVSCVCVCRVGVLTSAREAAGSILQGKSYILWFSSTAFFSTGVKLIVEGGWNRNKTPASSFRCRYTILP